MGQTACSTSNAGLFCSPKAPGAAGMALEISGLGAADNGAQGPGCCKSASAQAVAVEKTIKRIPCRAAAEAEPEKMRNPEVLTPKAPPQVPYAVAGGPDAFVTPIHGSLEPMPQRTAERLAAQRSQRPCRSIPRRQVASDVAEESTGTANSQGTAGPGSGFQRSPSFGEQRFASEAQADPQGVSSCSQMEDEDLWPPRLRAHVALYRERLRLFIQRTECGVRCRVVFADTAQPQLATYACHLPTATLRIVPIASKAAEVTAIRLAGICNIWLGSSGAGSIQGIGTGNTPGFMHFDTCDGAFGLLLEETGGERQEDILLDGLAVLIATCRQRARRRGEPPPSDLSLPGAPRKELQEAWQTSETRASNGLEALRPSGASLTAENLAGHAGALLAEIGEPVVPDEQLV